MRVAFATAYTLSAAAALGLELLWSRALALRLGSTASANAVVLGAFMAGLAIGGWLAARWARRSLRPGRAFAAAQAAGAALACLPLAPFISDLAPAFAAVLIASVPLGACFALAAALRQADGSGLGAGLGVLWALDASGGAIGALSTGFLGVWWLGVEACLLTAMALKLVAGLVAWVSPVQAKPNPSPAPAPEAARISTRPAWPLLAAVALQGFALLGAELVWTRLLSFTLYRGSTTFAMATMLAAVLLGAAGGARWAARGRPDRARAWGRARTAALLCAACLASSLALLLAAGPLPGQSALSFTDILLTLAVCGPAAFFSGAVFSAACAAAASGPGSTAGWLLAANAGGAALGAGLAPLVLVPAFGLAWTLLAMAGLSWLGSALLEKGTRSEQLVRWSLRAALVPIGLALATAGPAWVRHLGVVLFYDEGPDASVAVVEDPPGVKRLLVDGIAVAGTDLALVTDQKMLAHLPMLLHPQARRVLSVGFGAGGTSRALLTHPQLEVDCVEISPGVPRAAGSLQEVNGGLLEAGDARFRLHMQDARRYLADNPARWDLILNDCTDLAYRSDASLYTRDFFQQISEHLRPGGLAVAWVPLRGAEPHPSLGAVVASFTAVFSHCSLWVFDAFPTHFGLLVGGSQALELDCRQFLPARWPEAVRADLVEIGLADPARLAASLHLDDQALRRFAAGSAPHTDDRPRAEFLAALDSADDASAYDFLQRREFLPQVLGMRCPEPELRRRLGRRLRQRPWLLAGHKAWSADRPRQARNWILQALRIDPDDVQLHRLLGLPAMEPSLRLLLQGRAEAAVELLSGQPAELRRDLLLSLALLDAGEPDRAAELLAQLRDSLPPAPLAFLRWRASLPGCLSAATSPLTLPSL